MAVFTKKQGGFCRLGEPAIGKMIFPAATRHNALSPAFFVSKTQKPPLDIGSKIKLKPQDLVKNRDIGRKTEEKRKKSSDLSFFY